MSGTFSGGDGPEEVGVQLEQRTDDRVSRREARVHHRPALGHCNASHPGAVAESTPFTESSSATQASGRTPSRARRREIHARMRFAEPFTLRRHHLLERGAQSDPVRAPPRSARAVTTRRVPSGVLPPAPRRGSRGPPASAARARPATTALAAISAAPPPRASPRPRIARSPVSHRLVEPQPGRLVAPLRREWHAEPRQRPRSPPASSRAPSRSAARRDRDITACSASGAPPGAPGTGVRLTARRPPAPSPEPPGRPATRAHAPARASR